MGEVEAGDSASCFICFGDHDPLDCTGAKYLDHDDFVHWRDRRRRAGRVEDVDAYAPPAGWYGFDLDRFRRAVGLPEGTEFRWDDVPNVGTPIMDGWADALPVFRAQRGPIVYARPSDVEPIDDSWVDGDTAYSWRGGNWRSDEEVWAAARAATLKGQIDELRAATAELAADVARIIDNFGAALAQFAGDHLRQGGREWGRLFGQRRRARRRRLAVRDAGVAQRGGFWSAESSITGGAGQSRLRAVGARRVQPVDRQVHPMRRRV